jgi:hypothetical protein
MRERLIRLRPELAGAALLALAGTAWGQEFNITGLRTDSVMLYRDCKMDQGVAVTKQQFQGQVWPARKDPNSSLYYHVVRDGVSYCVKAFSVSTDQAVKVEKDSECGAKVAGRPPKTGAVRGVGEGCPK